MSSALAGSGAILAHGVGSRQDLPLPFAVAVGGAAAALVFSFVALALLWPQPRIDGSHAGWPLPTALAAALDSRACRVLTAALGGAFTLLVLAALLFGRDDTRNPVPYVVYILLWLGLVLLSVVFGPVWRRIDPLRSLHALVMRAAGSDPHDGLLSPLRLGYWPAAAGLLAFTWLELIAPDNATLPVLRTAIAMYAGTQLLCAFIFGARWFDRGEAFGAWSALFGAMSVLGRRADGRLVIRSPLAGLDALRAAPGLPATVAVMLGTTAYDGTSASPHWFTLVQSSAHPQALETLGLAGTVAAVALVFAACTAVAGRVGGAPAGQMPGAFAHSLIPIALGYLIAHYWSLLVIEGQNALVRLNDPLVTGADLVGLRDRAADTTLAQPTLIAAIQVLAVVAGHVLGVVLAHDRAVQLFPHRRAVLGQLPLLAMMILYTCTGLLLLFSE